MKKSNFLRYLWYRLENSALRTLVFTVLSVILSQSVISDAIRYREVEAIRYVDSGIYILAVVLGIVCTVIPMLENMGFKNRRNLDTLYFFPIKRERMALAHFLGGFIQAAFIYTVTFVVAGGYLAIKTDFFNLYYLLPYYFLSILLGFVVYSFFSFIFGQANTVADGVVMSILWAFALWVATYAMFVLTKSAYLDSYSGYSSYVSMRSLSNMPQWGIVYMPINNLTVIFQSLIEVNQSSWNEYAYAQRYLSQYYMFIIWGVIGIAAAIGYIYTFKKKGAQFAGEVSDSWFGYRLLIPIYGYSLLIMIGSIEIITMLVFMMMIIGYIIYRRSFRLKPCDLIVTALGTVPLILGMM